MTTPDLPRAPRPPTSGLVRHLTSADFRDGPVVLSQPGTRYVLMEDVVFNFPEPAAKESPHHLGFPFGIAVGASQVVLDLNGKTLRMHPNFRERQRFFALVSLDVTPFPVGRLGFTTEPVAPTDVVVRNGTLGLSSHFGIHANTLREGRLLLSDLHFEDFEVGAISLSGASDVHIRRCTVGGAVPPTTTSDVVMLRDLAAAARDAGAHSESAKLLQIMAKQKRNLTSSDALVRAIVIAPEFNVNGVPKHFKKRIQRTAINDCTFADLRAEPREVIGIALAEGGAPIKDLHGNIVSHDDARAGALVSRLQAAFSPDMPRVARQRLMAGPSSAFYPVTGLDRRAHSLVGKSSLFVRVDGCDSVTLRNIRAATVSSHGPHAAAVGIMLNGCKNVSLAHVSVRGSRVDHEGARDPLSLDRPQSGVLFRNTAHVRVDDYHYPSADSCGVAAVEMQDARFVRCKMGAPSTFLHCRHVSME